MLSKLQVSWHPMAGSLSKANMRRSIGLVGPYPPFRGGIAHFTEQLHTQLAKEGHAVSGVSFKRQYPAFLFPGKSQKTNIVGPNLDAVCLVDTINPLSWTSAARHLIERGVEEVVFMYWMPFFAPAFGRMASVLRSKGIQVTVIVHNAIPHENQPFSHALSKWFLSKCNRLIALSKAVERDISVLIPDRPVRVLPHPTYDQFGDIEDQAVARNRFNIGPDEKVLLFFGLVRRYKGLDILAKALGHSSGTYRLIVAGEWYEKDDALRETLIKNAPGAIIHDKYIADKDVAGYFSAADLVVQPYRAATQSGVVQTAFHFGRPVIVTGVGGLPEMVQHEEDALVVAPSDERALAMAIDRFFDPDLKVRLSEGAKRARERFTWKTFTDGLLLPEQGDHNSESR